VVQPISIHPTPVQIQGFNLARAAPISFLWSECVQPLLLSEFLWSEGMVFIASSRQ